MFRDFAQRIQLDRPLAYALSSRVWQAAAGPVTIALVIRWLSEDETGIYYNLVPIIGIQAFFELGLLNVLISQAGHANAACNAARDSDDSDAIAAASSRMAELIRASHRWFGLASVLFLFAAWVYGWSLFSNSDLNSGWQNPLLVIAPLAAVTVLFSPSLAILEGAGQRELIYRFRFVQLVCGSLAVWFALSVGLGVWAMVFAALVQALFVVYLALIHRRDFFRQFRRSETSEHFSWWHDVMPLQWRAAVIGAAHHLATQFLANVVLAYHTAAESGRLGMTLSITMAIQMLALAWAQTKYSVISGLHGQGEREQAGTMWRRTAVVSTILLVAGFSALIVVILGLGLFERGWEKRFVEPWHLAILGVGCLANHLVALQSFYLLARNEKPMVAASVPGLLVTALCVWVGGYHYGTSGVVVAFAVGLGLILLPMHTIGYLRRRANVAV